jgi:hypothetical protein
MIFQRDERTLGPVCLGIMLAAGVIAAPHAGAASFGHGGNGNQIGNGRLNRNAVSVNSPSFQYGQQHITNQNVGGINTVHNAICKRHRYCSIRQKIIFW